MIGLVWDAVGTELGCGVLYVHVQIGSTRLSVGFRLYTYAGLLPVRGGSSQVFVSSGQLIPILMSLSVGKVHDKYEDRSRPCFPLSINSSYSRTPQVVCRRMEKVSFVVNKICSW